jgi:hypothetical protein
VGISKDQAESFLGGGAPQTASDHPFPDHGAAERFLDSKPQGQPQEAPPSDEFPFWIKSGFAALDSLPEREMFAQKVYGKENVSKRMGASGLSDLVTGGGKEKLFVKINGKDTEVPDDFGLFSGNFTAGVVGKLPEMGGSVAGGISGGTFGAAVGGPVGAFAGAVIGSGLGALGGYAAKQVAKEATGTYNKTPTEAVEAGLNAYTEGAVGEIGGRVVGAGAKALLGGKVIPRFMSGVTDESASKAEKAWDAGARPSYVSIAPASRRLARIEIDSDKLTGKSVKNDERNFKYVVGEIQNLLTESGLPKGQVEGIIKHISDPNAPPFVGREAGQVLQKGVQATVQTLEHHVEAAGKEADMMIDVRLENINKMIDAHPAGMLADDTSDMIKNAKQQFSQVATQMYERIHTMLGGARVVPTEGIRDAARQITSMLPKTAVSAMVREMSQLAKRNVSPEDAVLLKEFGIDIGTDKIGLKDAQRRTSLEIQSKVTTSQSHTL